MTAGAGGAATDDIGVRRARTIPDPDSGRLEQQAPASLTRAPGCSGQYTTTTQKIVGAL
jgi:hypothetical protein